jgi:hypothetical protein
MTKEEKQLLLKDICARQFYGTKVLGPWEKDGPCELSAIDLTHNRQVRIFEDWFNIDDVKPYLRPMSSMTEEEAKEFAMLQTDFYSDGWLYPIAAVNMVDWLIAHHFDFRGLIPMGLALEAPADMYKIE